MLTSKDCYWGTLNIPIYSAALNAHVFRRISCLHVTEYSASWFFSTLNTNNIPATYKKSAQTKFNTTIFLVIALKMPVSLYIHWASQCKNTHHRQIRLWLRRTNLTPVLSLESRWSDGSSLKGINIPKWPQMKISKEDYWHCTEKTAATLQSAQTLTPFYSHFVLFPNIIQIIKLHNAAFLQRQ